MSRRPAPSSFYYDLPTNEWFRLPEVIDRIHPEFDYNDRKKFISIMATYINRRVKWGEAAKEGERGRMLYCV